MRAFFVFRPHWRRLITQPSGACAEAAIFGRWTVPSTGLVVIAPATEAIPRLCRRKHKTAEPLQG